MSETAWMGRGACTTEDPELFHPDFSPVMLTAQKVCNRCPVIAECLAYALARMDDEGDGDPARRAIGAHGVWGGTTPGDRWRMLGRRQARHGVAVA